MFTQTARFYDAIYSFKDYKREADILLEMLSSKIGGTLLDVACGSGKHLELLRRHFDCEGLDLDPVLLDVARQRLPGVTLHHGDMTDFRLGKRFDVITCLFSAIGETETTDRLNAALRCFAEHTNPGGIVIVEPWLDPSVWDPKHLHALFVDEPDLKIARMSIPKTDGHVSVVEFEYLISTYDGIERASEVHRLGLFTRDEYLRAFQQAGLDGEFVETGLTGRGLFIGRPAV
jgi:ubiquinone/menaquinone biosynthesis C-methylase UbiE